MIAIEDINKDEVRFWINTDRIDKERNIASRGELLDTCTKYAFASVNPSSYTGIYSHLRYAKETKENFSMMDIEDKAEFRYFVISHIMPNVVDLLNNKLYEYENLSLTSIEDIPLIQKESIIRDTDSRLLNDLESEWIGINGDVKLKIFPEVRIFCENKGIREHLNATIDLIRSCFINAKGARCEVIVNPETGEEWLDVNLHFRDEVNKVFECYELFTKIAIDSIPWFATEKIRISFTFI